MCLEWGEWESRVPPPPGILDLKTRLKKHYKDVRFGAVDAGSDLPKWPKCPNRKRRNGDTFTPHAAVATENQAALSVTTGNTPSCGAEDVGRPRDNEK